MKFKYTNSNNEEAIYEASPLTAELYEGIINSDRNFLSQVVEGKHSTYSDSVYRTAATEMLSSYGKGRESTFNSSTKDLEILLIQNKVNLSEIERPVKKNSIKQQLRSHFLSSQIRAFKKDKMNFDI